MDRDEAWEAAMDRRLDECLEGDRPWPPQVARARAKRPIRIPILFKGKKPFVVVMGVRK